MPNDYDELKRELLEKIEGIDATAKEAEQVGTRLPGSVVYGLCHGVICAMNADEKLTEGNKEEATKKMQEAVNHVNYVLSNASRIVRRGQDLDERGKDMGNGKDSAVYFITNNLTNNNYYGDQYNDQSQHNQHSTTSIATDISENISSTNVEVPQVVVMKDGIRGDIVRALIVSLVTSMVDNRDEILEFFGRFFGD